MFLSTDNPKFKHLKCLETNYMKIRDEIPIFDKSTVTIKRRQGAWYDTETGTNLLKELVASHLKKYKDFLFLLLVLTKHEINFFQQAHKSNKICNCMLSK